MTHHNINASPPNIPGPPSIHHNPQSPSLNLNETGISPPLNLSSNPSTSIVPPTLVHSTPHNPAFSLPPEAPVLWDPLTSVEVIPTVTSSASSGDVQSQISRLLFNLLPSGPSVPVTAGAVPQTPARASATSNLDSFIHSPSPMSFPLSSERGLVVPTQAATISTPINSRTYSPPISKTSFLKSLDYFDRGVLESYIIECSTSALLTDFELPKNDALYRYLCAYFENMHEHHPFIHTATFEPVAVKGS
jgi:hypothetical protein